MSTMQKRPLSQRQGLNCTLSYNHVVKNTYRCRVSAITHGISGLLDEAAGRNRRTAYPHRLTPQAFTITVLLNGYFEYTDFRDWMMFYSGFLIDDQLSDHGTDRAMTVSVPSRRFMRKGMLLQGISFGDHVGSMVWEIPFVFESLNNPLERAGTARLSLPSFGTAAGLAPETPYFYPFGTQLHGDQQGTDYSEPLEVTPEVDVATTSDTTADLPPVDVKVPPPSGATGDTAKVLPNTMPGPTEKTIPESIHVRLHADGVFPVRNITVVPMQPMQPIKQDGAVVGYVYHDEKNKNAKYDVFSSGNVADHSSGQVAGQVN